MSNNENTQVNCINTRYTLYTITPTYSGTPTIANSALIYTNPSADSNLGRVGIRTTNPSAALDVNGTLQVNGNTTMNSNLNVSNTVTTNKLTFAG